jgi:flagellar hook-length control protein FliK
VNTSKRDTKASLSKEESTGLEGADGTSPSSVNAIQAATSTPQLLPGDSIALLQALTALAAQSTQSGVADSTPSLAAGGQEPALDNGRTAGPGLPPDLIAQAGGKAETHGRLDPLRLHAGRDPHPATPGAIFAKLSEAEAAVDTASSLGASGSALNLAQVREESAAASIAQLHLPVEASAAAIANADATPSSALSAANAAVIAANSMQSPSAAASAGTTPSSEIHAAFGARSWNNELVASVHHFVMDKIEVAEIKLNPAEMGPVRVEIAYDNGQAAVHFSAQREETREALAQSFDRLRENLAQSGVTLNNASTGSFGEGRAFGFMQQQAQSGRQRNAAREAAATLESSPVLGSVGVARSVGNAPRGNVDLFA